MTCTTIRYADHAVIQMDARGIETEDVEIVVSLGVKIANYPTDKPYPSCLLLGFINQLPLHVVLGQDLPSGLCVVITAYWPDPNKWETDFKTKLQKR
jgi:hypothetical protein